MIRVIVIKSAFITKNSKIELFEGTIDQFEKYIIDNFSNWFNGYVDSCKSVAHTIINDGLGNCKCDHIGVALLHNGSVSLSGVPYIKFGIIAEKYKPIRCPHDIDLSAKYKEEDIMQHNRLPSCVVQNKNIEFEIEDDSILVDVDPSLYLKCKNLGIKRIAFEAFQDIHGLTTGFIVIYKFNSEPFDMGALHSTANTFEHLYQNMLASFD